MLFRSLHLCSGRCWLFAMALVIMSLWCVASIGTEIVVSCVMVGVALAPSSTVMQLSAGWGVVLHLFVHFTSGFSMGGLDMLGVVDRQGVNRLICCRLFWGWSHCILYCFCLLGITGREFMLFYGYPLFSDACVPC